MRTADARATGQLRGVLAPGSSLGRYEVVRLLSTGGMAEIYLGRAEGIAGFEKRVVLKRMLPTTRRRRPSWRRWLRPGGQ